MKNIRAAITGTGKCLPDFVLSNAELEKMIDTTDEWITSRTGIKERRMLKIPGEGLSWMAERAVKELLEKTGTDPLEVEMLILTTITGDMVFPATANVVCDKVGLKNAWGFDLSAACSGFIYGLTVGTQFIETGFHKKIIVVGGDKMSSIIDYTDRSTCIIFGDGCGAVLLEPSKDANGIHDAILHSDGAGRQFLHQKAGGSVKPASHETVDAREHYVYQDGKTVYKYAVANMADVSVRIMERNQLKAEDVDWLVPHQANKRIIDSTRERMGLPEAKVMMNIERYGNTTNGTIPLLLADYESQLKPGDKLIISAFGGGFTWGAIYLTWAY